MLCLTGGSLAAQSGGDADLTGQLALSRAQLQVERQAIITRAMEFTDGESNTFWPLYREYQGKLEEVIDRQVALLRDYAASYDTLTDKQSEDLVKRYQDSQKDKLKVQQDYFKKFKKILPPRKVARYFQLENKLDAIVAYDLARTVPLVR